MVITITSGNLKASADVDWKELSQKNLETILSAGIYRVNYTRNNKVIRMTPEEKAAFEAFKASRK